MSEHEEELILFSDSDEVDLSSSTDSDGETNLRDIFNLLEDFLNELKVLFNKKDKLIHNSSNTSKKNTQKEKKYLIKDNNHQNIQYDNLSSDFIKSDEKSDLYLKIKHNKSVMVSLEYFIFDTLNNNKVLPSILFQSAQTVKVNQIVEEIAKKLKVSMKILDKEVETKGDLSGLLASLNTNDILFIPKSEMISNDLIELVQKASKDLVLEISIGQGIEKRSIKLDLAPFTLIVTTDKINELSSSLINTFFLKYKIESQTKQELKEVCRRLIKEKNIEIDDECLDKVIEKSKHNETEIINTIIKMAILSKSMEFGKIDTAFCEKYFLSFSSNR
jgi:Holliday junction resolvasome RuvABC ATP-dependent DNA helicase subunit